MQHESAKLREYLVVGIEDPRINLQSILSRHFLLRALFGDKFRELMEHECRFAAIVNWFKALDAKSDPEAHRRLPRASTWRGQCRRH